MKVLHLTLKKKWFDMIASGEKTEEYREIKPFWIKRLQAWGNAYDPCRDFNQIKFYNGWACSEKYPSITLESKGIDVGYGKPEWGAEPNKEYYIIKLGKLLNQLPPPTP